MFLQVIVSFRAIPTFFIYLSATLICISRLPCGDVPGGETRIMIRSELVQCLVAANPELSQRDVEAIVGTFFEEITRRLAKDGRVELRGFGAFSTRPRDARTGRNPRTGETVAVDAKRVPYFKPGKEMRARLNV